MNKLPHILIIVILLLLFATIASADPFESRVLKPDATIDFRSDDGVAMVNGQWKYSDARVVEVDHRAPGHDLRPSGDPIRTNDIEPKAGAADFDDSQWHSIAAGSLEARRGTGRLSFNWYRIKLTIPETVGEFDPTGSTVIFEIVLDDYAEVYVDGKLPQVLGTVAANSFTDTTRPIESRSRATPSPASRSRSRSSE